METLLGLDEKLTVEELLDSKCTWLMAAICLECKGLNKCIGH